MTDETAMVRAYTRALLGAARAAGVLPDVRRDWEKLLEALAASSDLRSWVCRQVPSAPERRVARTRELLGGLVSPGTRRLLERMAAWNHLHLIPAVAKRFEQEARRLEGRRTAHVVCAQTPREATLSELRDRLAGDGKPVEFEVRTDPALLAGLTVRLEDRVFDASLAGRLARLRQALANPGRAPATASASSR